MTQLTRLDFSTPALRYECCATYQNDEGQEFRLLVRASEKAEVEKFISNLYASFELLSDESIPSLPTESLESDSDSQLLSVELEEVNENLDSQDEVLLTDAIELVIEAPENSSDRQSSLFKFNWNMALNRVMLKISPSKVHTSPSVNVTQCQATVTVSSGASVYAKIDGGVPWEPSRWEGTAKPGSRPLILRKKSANGQLTNFTLTLKPNGATASVHVEEKYWKIV